MPPVRFDHPPWCGGEPLCTARTGGTDAAHRSEPATFATSTVAVEMALHQAAPAAPFASVVVDDGRNSAGVTMSIDDGWRFAEIFTELLDRAR